MDVGASLLRSTQGDQHPSTRSVVEALSDLMLKEIQSADGNGERDLARELQKRALALAEPVLGRRHHATQRLRYIKIKP